MPGEHVSASAARIGGENTEGAELLLDTAALTAKYSAEPRPRGFEMTFQAPQGLSQRTLENGAKIAIEKWLHIQAQRGWRLTSKVVIGPPGPAHDLETGVLVLDRHEYRVRAVFDYTRSLRIRRTELPPALTKQAPDHTVRVGGPHSEISKLIRAGR